MGRCWSDAGPCGGVVRCGGWSRDIWWNIWKAGLWFPAWTLLGRLDVLSLVIGGLQWARICHPCFRSCSKTDCPRHLGCIQGVSERLLLLVEMSQSAASPLHLPFDNASPQPHARAHGLECPCGNHRRCPPIARTRPNSRDRRPAREDHDDTITPRERASVGAFQHDELLVGQGSDVAIGHMYKYVYKCVCIYIYIYIYIYICLRRGPYARMV